MSIARTLFAVLLFGSLGGCASMAAIKQSIDEARANWDSRYALRIQEHKAAVSLRADTLTDKPRTVNALQAACAQGRYVETFLHVNDYPLAAGLQHSCVRVFLTSDRKVLQSPTFLILDGGYTVLVNGQETFPKASDLTKELNYRDYLRVQSTLF